MSQKALGEPAILYLIFQDLSQLELFPLQKVCRAWYRTITTDKRLLATLFLHPGPPPFGIGIPALNPLLAQKFEAFFPSYAGDHHENHFIEGGPNFSPFGALMGGHGELEWQVLEKYKHPEASWRRMLPCNPPTAELQLHFESPHSSAMKSKITRLKFSNDDNGTTSKLHPPWLTFGMIYDVVEAAWFHGSPHYVASASFNFVGYRRTMRPPENGKWRCGNALRGHEIPEHVSFTHDLWTTSPRPGRVSLHFKVDDSSAEERETLHRQARRKIMAWRNKRWRLTTPDPKRDGVPFGVMNSLEEYVFTDEFHFKDALAFTGVMWDQVLENDPQDVVSGRRRRLQ